MTQVSWKHCYGRWRPTHSQWVKTGASTENKGNRSDRRGGGEMEPHAILSLLVDLLSRLLG